MDKLEFEALFRKEYRDSGEILYFFCPGRVNLIGEHIDYNGGNVFPAALTIGIYAAVVYNSGSIIRLRSLNTPKPVEINLDEPIEYDKKDGWGNFPKGIIKYLKEEGEEISGCDILYYGNLPEEAGLSSSAAIEVLTGYLLQYKTRSEQIDRLQLAKLSKRVENEFIGVNSGIMDQFAVAMGKADNAMLLDTTSLEYEYVPFTLKDHNLMIMNTGTRRELASSKYNERRKECDQALEIIRKEIDSPNLCAVKLEDAERLITDEVLLKRTRHVITENQRVLEAVEALKKEDIITFGKLMTGSHSSLKNNYEVTGTNLDAITDAALSVEACIGARMTGAGFGGCAIALVENSSIEEFKEIVSEKYFKATGIKAEIYPSTIGEGVHKLGVNEDQMKTIE